MNKLPQSQIVGNRETAVNATGQQSGYQEGGQRPRLAPGKAALSRRTPRRWRGQPSTTLKPRNFGVRRGSGALPRWLGRRRRR